jgi:hypothetical protein
MSASNPFLFIHDEGAFDLSEPSKENGDGRLMDRPRFVADGPLDEAMANLWEYANAGQAASRAACGRVITELAEALNLLGSFDVYNSVPDDHGYVGSSLQLRTAEFLRRNGLHAMNQGG